MLDVNFWEGRYAENTLTWDLGEAAPPFQTLPILGIASDDKPGSTADAKKPEAAPASAPLLPGKMAVIGAGVGHDAAFFARSGFAVTAFDYAEGAIERSRQVYDETLFGYVRANIFEIPDAYAGTFDYVLEHTCFCAIHPTEREAYVQVIHRLLKPGGRLVGLFWAHSQEGGPPYASTGEEILSLFKPQFDIERFDRPDNSIERRRDEEFIAVFRKRA